MSEYGKRADPFRFRPQILTMPRRLNIKSCLHMFPFIQGIPIFTYSIKATSSLYAKETYSMLNFQIRCLSCYLYSIVSGDDLLRFAHSFRKLRSSLHKFQTGANSCLSWLCFESTLLLWLNRTSAERSSFACVTLDMQPFALNYTSGKSDV